MSDVFRTIVVHGLGFTQTWERETGLEKIWAASRRFCSPDVWILPPLPWDTDAQAIAAMIRRHSTPQTRIIGRFYSWGGGWFFPRLAKALNGRGHRRRDFWHVTLCDPVYRSPYLPAWAPVNPLSLMHGAIAPKIVVPVNVHTVDWLRQLTDTPRAHDLIAEAPAVTNIHEPRVLVGVKHSDMDDHEVFAAQCEAVMERAMACMRVEAEACT